MTQTECFNLIYVKFLLFYIYNIILHDKIRTVLKKYSNEQHILKVFIPH